MQCESVGKRRLKRWLAHPSTPTQYFQEGGKDGLPILVLKQKRRLANPSWYLLAPLSTLAPENMPCASIPHSVIFAVIPPFLETRWRKVHPHLILHRHSSPSDILCNPSCS